MRVREKLPKYTYYFIPVFLISLAVVETALGINGDRNELVSVGCFWIRLFLFLLAVPLLGIPLFIAFVRMAFRFPSGGNFTLFVSGIVQLFSLPPSITTKSPWFSKLYYGTLLVFLLVEVVALVELMWAAWKTFGV